MDSSRPGSSVQGISQARILEWAAISFSRGSSQGLDPRLLLGRQILLPLSHQGSCYMREITGAGAEESTENQIIKR